MEYYNVNRILNEKSMPIYSSLLKHGYQSFSLTKLEFCDVNSLVSREKHYFDVYSPEYNILKLQVVLIEELGENIQKLQ